MRHRLVLAALVVAPLVAAAQAPASTGSERSSPAWSFGGGLSVAVLPTLGSNVVGTIGTSAPIVPVINASLERRWSSRSWLVVGASGAVERYRADVPTDAYGFTRNDSRSVSVTAGVRRVVSAGGAPVDVSILALVQAGTVDGELRQTSFGSVRNQDVTSWLAGASAGIAVDRELGRGLSLRVASPLVGASYGRGRIDEPGQPRRSTSDFSVQALLAPRLELRVLF